MLLVSCVQLAVRPQDMSYLRAKVEDQACTKLLIYGSNVSLAAQSSPSAHGSIECLVIATAENGRGLAPLSVGDSKSDTRVDIVVISELGNMAIVAALPADYADIHPGPERHLDSIEERISRVHGWNGLGNGQGWHRVFCYLRWCSKGHMILGFSGCQWDCITQTDRHDRGVL